MTLTDEDKDRLIAQLSRRVEELEAEVERLKNHKVYVVAIEPLKPLQSGS